MIRRSKVKKLILHLREMTRRLIGHRYNLEIHRKINQFYYMEKEEELEMLLKQVDEITERLSLVQRKLESEYKDAYSQWSKDVRWMNEYPSESLETTT